MACMEFAVFTRFALHIYHDSAGDSGICRLPKACNAGTCKELKGNYIFFCYIGLNFDLVL